MKAIIPVAGAGTKLRPHTYTQPKALIPLAGKTILSIIVDQLVEAGVKEFIFIIGYLGDKIQDFVEEKYPYLETHFIQQHERMGIGHAILLTRELVKEDEIIVVLGDSICEYDVKEVIESDTSLLAVKRVDDPRDFGVAEINEEGLITKVVEKPQIPKSNMALTGIYRIRETALLFECLDNNFKGNVTSYGEFNLTDALECMIGGGATIRAYKVKNWFDCGKKESLLESNAILLKKMGQSIAADKPFENTIIIPPVSIAAGCDISNSIIGPNVAIGECVTISDSIIKDSIIGSFADLKDIVLTHSLIGSDTEVRGESRSLNIGDNTEIDLGKR
ncbi:sugar phosphate nucleotidyltransferase [Flavihumibacter cheonanensis]|uniref:sugar phosphate nucleotidyltransferase n=1 Tax=Flavihumibacter cheonanensis TaxID=1442385 RepID=UPI001EF83A36|nr:sugar phosphate nucleotidyltransferase [Flavihumibacter cheonanensis]MCG7753502.1 NTP transferase domain-containing protein [Flavihumibacter cheonanensis]